MLTKPLADATGKPIVAASLWAVLAVIATVAVGLLVGGVGAAISLVRSWFSDSLWAFPWDAVRVTGRIGIPVVLLASTWAATYASARRHLWRVIPASIVGGGIALLFLSATPFGAAVGGLATSWAIAIPFERWSRLGARLGAVGVGLIGTLLVPEAAGWGMTSAQVAAGAPIAGAILWIGDSLWKATLRVR